MKVFLNWLVTYVYNPTVGALLHKTRPKRAEEKTTPQPPKHSVVRSILSPLLEAYDVSLQSLLIWERPYLSAVSFVLLNCLFWLVVSWNRQFISISAIIGLAVFLYKTWVNQIWPEIAPPPAVDDSNEDWIKVHPQLLNVPELSQFMNDLFENLSNCWRDMMHLRKTNHGMFCLLVCTALSFIAFIGSLIPGVIIIYCIVLALSLGPGIALHIIPSNIYDQLAGLFTDDTSASKTSGDRVLKKCDSDLDEFLPENSEELMKQLSLRQESLECTMSSLGSFALEEEADEHHLTTIRELGIDSFISESDESTLYKGMGSFPCVEEENESDLEDDFSPSAEPAPVEETSNEINFVSTHFKEESSESESDAAFTQGLSFTPTDEEKQKANKKVLPGKSSAKATTSKTEQTPQAMDTDDDDELMDFEILEKSDIS